MFRLFRDYFSFSLKKNFSIFFGFQMLLIIASLFLIVAMYQNQKLLSLSRDTQFNLYLLADELRQSSDDLTRFARAYVATGDLKFEQAYWRVLDIRNGKIARPVDYEKRVYWDLFFTRGTDYANSDGVSAPLSLLMADAGFTDAELIQLKISQKRSDELVKIEVRAMNAVKGLFDDGSGNYAVIKEPDIVLANELLNGDEYYQIKA